jgi:HEPN domain-containing protein
MREEVEEWVRQAQEDILAVQTNLQGGRYNWACFIAQQAAEKALKAL